MMNAKTYKQLLLIVRVVAIAFFVLLIAWLLKKDFVPSGHLTLSHHDTNPSPFFSKWVPKQRTQVLSDGVEIDQEPVYTTITYPRPFKEADISVSFKNPNNQFAEIGPLADNGQGYDLHALYHPALEALFLDPEWAQSGQLFERRSADYQYVSAVQLFTSELPDQNLTGYYGVNWEKPYIPASSKAADASIPVPLQGAHTFYVAPSTNPLKIKLSYRDMNQRDGADPLAIVLKNWKGEVVDRQEYQDDGETGQGLATAKQDEQISFDLPDANGVYQLEVQTSQDIILESFSVNTPYLVVKDRLQVAGGKNYTSKYGLVDMANKPLYTSARSWQAQADGEDNLQTFRMVGDSVQLEDPMQPVLYRMSKQHRFLLYNGYQVFPEQGGFIIQGKGVFAFSQDAYFTPLPWYLDSTTDLSVLGLDYVLTNYHAPHKDGSVYTQTIPVDLTTAFAPDKQLRLELSLPELSTGQSIEVTGMQADFSADPVTFSNAWQKLQNFINREILHK